MCWDISSHKKKTVNNERHYFECEGSLLVASEFHFLYLVRNILAKKIEPFWNWNYRVDNSKILPLLTQNTLALIATTAYCHNWFTALPTAPFFVFIMSPI